MDTTGRLYDDFIRLLFMHAHREASALANELPEESDQFHFLTTVCFANCWFDHGESVGYADPFPGSFSSTFCLSGTC